MSSKIPVKNIYYMLCYAWNVLEQSESVLVGSEKFDNIYNLLGRIYITGTNSLIKRGLSRSYIQEQEEMSTLKGKVKIADSIKRQTFQHGRMVCQYDNFSADMKLNQIIKATINILLKVPQLDWELKKKLQKLRIYFASIQDIQLSKPLFSSNRLNRNNQHYRMLINISELIYEGLITRETGNQVVFSDFIRDRQMAKLYEKFVLNFYKKHLFSENFHIHSPKLQWKLDSDVNEENLSLLPEMRTDIVIENKRKNTQLIIDTKFYGETLVSGNWTNIEKLRTGHLYQILAYVNNSNYFGTVKGMLLYPTIAKDIDADYRINGKDIHIRTLNLNVEWGEIVDRLVSIV